MKSQAEIVKNMTDRELLQQLYGTQVIILILSGILSLFFFDDKMEFFTLFHWELLEIFLYGGSGAFIVILIDVLMMKFLPKEYYDDGGINERIFAKRPVWHIFFLTALIAFSEEILFRGVIQTTFGFVVASTIFAVLHFRYLRKWVLLIVVLLLSFFIGWIFEITGNLLVTIFAHFLIDFVLGVLIHMQSLKQKQMEMEGW